MDKFVVKVLTLVHPARQVRRPLLRGLGIAFAFGSLGACHFTCSAGKPTPDAGVAVASPALPVSASLPEASIGPPAPFELRPADVRRIDSRHFEVKREVFSRWAESVDLKGGRHLVPHVGADGGVDGVRLVGVAPASPLERLGLEEGDVLHTLNGANLASTEETLRLYTQLPTTPRLELVLTRNGRTTSVFYDIL